MEPLTFSQLDRMLERGELSAAVWHRRRTLLAVAALAARSKTAQSRWRLKRFLAALEVMEGNDEIEVTGETLCKTLLHTIDATKPNP